MQYHVKNYSNQGNDISLGNIDISYMYAIKSGRRDRECLDSGCIEQKDGSSLPGLPSGEFSSDWLVCLIAFILV